MVQKWYVVTKGWRPGVYATWLDAAKHIDGYPGPIYQKFKRKSEAISHYQRICGPLPEPPQNPWVDTREANAQRPERVPETHPTSPPRTPQRSEQHRAIVPRTAPADSRSSRQPQAAQDDDVLRTPTRQGRSDHRRLSLISHSNESSPTTPRAPSESFSLTSPDTGATYEWDPDGRTARKSSSTKRRTTSLLSGTRGAPGSRYMSPDTDVTYELPQSSRGSTSPPSESLASPIEIMESVSQGPGLLFTENILSSSQPRTGELSDVKNLELSALPRRGALRKSEVVDKPASSPARSPASPRKPTSPRTTAKVTRRTIPATDIPEWPYRESVRSAIAGQSGWTTVKAEDGTEQHLLLSTPDTKRELPGKPMSTGLASGLEASTENMEPRQTPLSSPSVKTARRKARDTNSSTASRAKTRPPSNPPLSALEEQDDGSFREVFHLSYATMLSGNSAHRDRRKMQSRTGAESSQGRTEKWAQSVQSLEGRGSSLSTEGQLQRLERRLQASPTSTPISPSKSGSVICRISSPTTESAVRRLPDQRQASFADYAPLDSSVTGRSVPSKLSTVSSEKEVRQLLVPDAPGSTTRSASSTAPSEKEVRNLLVPDSPSEDHLVDLLSTISLASGPRFPVADITNTPTATLTRSNTPERTRVGSGQSMSSTTPSEKEVRDLLQSDSQSDLINLLSPPISPNRARPLVRDTSNVPTAASSTRFNTPQRTRKGFEAATSLGVLPVQRSQECCANRQDRDSPCWCWKCCLRAANILNGHHRPSVQQDAQRQTSSSASGHGLLFQPVHVSNIARDVAVDPRSPLHTTASVPMMPPSGLYFPRVSPQLQQDAL